METNGLTIIHRPADRGAWNQPRLPAARTARSAKLLPWDQTEDEG